MKQALLNKLQKTAQTNDICIDLFTGTDLAWLEASLFQHMPDAVEQHHLSLVTCCCHGNLGRNLLNSCMQQHSAVFESERGFADTTCHISDYLRMPDTNMLGKHASNYLLGDKFHLLDLISA